MWISRCGRREKDSCGFLGREERPGLHLQKETWFHWVVIGVGLLVVVVDTATGDIKRIEKE